MDINLIFRIAAVGILVSILSQVLKHSGREEQAFLASLAGLILVLSLYLRSVSDDTSVICSVIRAALREQEAAS